MRSAADLVIGIWTLDFRGRLHDRRPRLRFGQFELPQLITAPSLPIPGLSVLRFPYIIRGLPEAIEANAPMLVISVHQVVQG